MPTPESAPHSPSAYGLLRAYDRAWQHWNADPSPRAFAVLQTGIEILYRSLEKPGKFALGQVIMTPGADDALVTAQHVPPEFLLRHVHGDWGELCAEDRRANERSLRVGSRLLCAYRTRREEKLWVITEWDRRVTTLLLPEEY